MTRFQPLSDTQLEALSDEALIVYIRAAGEAGDTYAAGRGLAILTWGHEPFIELRVARKVPLDAVRQVVDAVIDSVIDKALEGTVGFSGSTLGEFEGWLSSIIRRRVVDYYRMSERRFRPVALAEEADGETDAVWLPVPDETNLVAERLLIEQVLNERSARHRAIARLTILAGVPAAEIVSRVPDLTEANVYKIAQRFRDDLGEARG